MVSKECWTSVEYYFKNELGFGDIDDVEIIVFDKKDDRVLVFDSKCKDYILSQVEKDLRKLNFRFSIEKVDYTKKPVFWTKRLKELFDKNENFKKRWFFYDDKITEIWVLNVVEF